MDGHIRRFDDGDTEAVIRIWAGANALAHPFLRPEFVAQTAVDLRNLYLPNAETWVLELESGLAGFISLIGDEIGGLFVDPAHIGRGLGRRLVDHAVALHGPLRVEVFRDNEIGRPFYERAGFRDEGDYLHEPSGAVVCRMTMQAAAKQAE